jgi:hypothetical protein
MPESSGQQTLRSKCFLSLPHLFDTVRDALRRMIEQLGGEAYAVVDSLGSTLLDEITSGIASSSILIADLSSSSDAKGTPEEGPRPTIMWEVGLAQASGLSIIFICQNRDTDRIPAVFKSHHIIYYDLLKVAPMIEKVQNLLQTLMSRGQAAAMNVFSSICYVDRRSVDLEGRYLRATDRIKLLELNLETVALQVPVINRALERNHELSVQILTLNPFSRWAEDRANQLAEMPLRYSKMLCTKLKETHRGLLASPADRWSLRIYDTFPTQIMFQIDKSLIHSIIAMGRQSRNMLHFEIQRTQPNAYDTFEAHFARLWSGSDAYEVWYERNEKKVELLLGISV